jgi:hypothetical protein
MPSSLQYGLDEEMERTLPYYYCFVVIRTVLVAVVLVLALADALLAVFSAD